MLIKTARLAFVLVCLAVTPLFANRGGTATAADGSAKPVKSTAKRAAQKRPGAAAKNRVWTDMVRLGAILADAQTNDDLGAQKWKVIADESNALIDRTYTLTTGAKRAHGAAKQVQDAVHEMGKAAVAGNMEGIKNYAGIAIRLNAFLIAWAKPDGIEDVED